MKKTSKQSVAKLERTILKVKVIPNAPKTEFVGWMGDVLKVKIKAQAQEGAANEALVEFLANVLDVKRNQIEIMSGATARMKLVGIEGIVDLKCLG
jgi:uncharacterized protein (TIGR00251 family)